MKVIIETKFNVGDTVWSLFATRDNKKMRAYPTKITEICPFEWGDDGKVKISYFITNRIEKERGWKYEEHLHPTEQALKDSLFSDNIEERLDIFTDEIARNEKDAYRTQAGDMKEYYKKKSASMLKEKLFVSNLIKQQHDTHKKAA